MEIEVSTGSLPDKDVEGSKSCVRHKQEECNRYRPAQYSVCQRYSGNSFMVKFVGVTKPSHIQSYKEGQ